MNTRMFVGIYWGLTVILKPLWTDAEKEAWKVEMGE